MSILFLFETLIIKLIIPGFLTGTKYDAILLFLCIFLTYMFMDIITALNLRRKNSESNLL